MPNLEWFYIQMWKKNNEEHLKKIKQQEEEMLRLVNIRIQEAELDKKKNNS